MTTSTHSPASERPDVGAAHIVVLGGAGDATALLRALHAEAGLNIRITLSLAGRTRQPAPPQQGGIAVTQRSGGFGGPQGLADFLRAQNAVCLVDATHPFAARMSANAAAAAELAGLPLLRLVRPAWQAGAGDDWRMVADMAGAVAAIGAAPRRVLLTIGRQNLATFMAAPQHSYVARTIEAADAAVQFDHVSWIAARGPFSLADELALFQHHRIEVLVSKNSGGQAMSAKLAAARELGVPVIMIARPPSPGGLETPDVAEAVAWLRQRTCERPDARHDAHHDCCAAAERGA